MNDLFDVQAQEIRDRLRYAGWTCTLSGKTELWSKPGIYGVFALESAWLREQAETKKAAEAGKDAR